MTGKNISKKLQCVKKMPPLKHKVGNGAFDITKSEVVQWLILQPEILQWVFDHIVGIKHHEKNLLIEYDPSTGTWQGVDYAD